jgi:inorganic pyrophosphatase
MAASTTPSAYTVRRVGRPNTLEYRVYIEKNGFPISSWHDVPLYADEEKMVFNMVVKIPRWMNPKFEVRLFANLKKKQWHKSRRVVLL